MKNYWDNKVDEWYESRKIINVLYPKEVDKKISRLIKAINVAPGCKVLDVGCGTGYYSNKLAEAGFILTGVDSSERMIEKALQMNRNNIEFIFSDICQLQLNNDFFDAIICILVMDYIDNPYLCLNGLHKIIKKNGNLIIDILGGISSIKTNNYFRRLHGKETHMNGILPWELKLLLKETGWNIIEEYPESEFESLLCADFEISDEDFEKLPFIQLKQVIASQWRVIASK